MIVKELLETLKNIAEVTRTDYVRLKENEVHSLVVDILSKSYSLINEFDKLKAKESLVEFNKNTHRIQQNLFSLRGTIRKKEIITGITPCIDTLIVQLSLLQMELSSTVSRAEVEYDLYRLDEPYVVEGWYNESGEEFTFVTYPNDCFLNSRPLTALSIDQSKYADSSVLKLISYLIESVDGKRICLTIPSTSGNVHNLLEI